MPLNLPDLDDLTWEDLVDEARSLIVSWAPSWTNHNPSDPGITLIELFAYLSETLIYRTNKIADSHVREFLKLLNGPDTGNLHQDKRQTVLDLENIHRAVTAHDFEKLVTQAGVELPSGEKVARVKCVFRRNLESTSPSAQMDDAPAHVSVVVVSNHSSHPSRELLKQLREILQPARLLTTQLHVTGPRYLKFRLRITLVPHPGVVAEALKTQAIAALEKFFDPRKGGADGKGWPFARNIYVSEIYQRLDDLPGVDYVRRSRQGREQSELDELVIAPAEASRLKRNKLGELEAVELRPDELVNLEINKDDLTISPV